MATDHVIQRKRIELHCASLSAANAAQDLVIQTWQSGLDQSLADALDRIVGSRQIVLDTLELDLGAISLAELQEAFPSRLLESLQESLADTALTAETQHASSTPPTDDPLGRVGRFLETGLLPWWGESATSETLRSELAEALAPLRAGQPQQKHAANPGEGAAPGLAEHEGPNDPERNEPSETPVHHRPEPQFAKHKPVAPSAPDRRAAESPPTAANALSAAPEQTSTTGDPPMPESTPDSHRQQLIPTNARHARHATMASVEAIAGWLETTHYSPAILERAVRHGGVHRGLELTRAISINLATAAEQVMTSIARGPERTIQDSEQDYALVLTTAWAFAREYGEHMPSSVASIRAALCRTLSNRLQIHFDSALQSDAAQRPTLKERSTHSDTPANERRVRNVRPAPANPYSSVTSVPPSPASSPELIACAHAGLVLLWPFLPSLFDDLHYLDQQTWRSVEHQGRALGMLHYLATGEKGLSEEWELPLHKILVGLEPHELSPPDFVPNETEIAAAHELLNAVIAHWKVLKATAVRSFQAGFLCAPGILSPRDQDWLVRIERRGWDVLLEHLPWSISWIRNPWMRSAIEVEW